MNRDAYQPSGADERVLFPEPPCQKHSWTSREAARSVKASAARQRETVYAAISAAGAAGLTDDEGMRLLKLPGNSYRPRRIELSGPEPPAKPRIRPEGYRKTLSGRNAVVWVVV